MQRPDGVPVPPVSAPISPTGRRNPHSKDPKGRGRPRRVTWDTQRFNLRAEDLIIETFGGLENRTAVITHKPSGITVEGHNPDFPGSRLAARKEAMFNLMEKLEELENQE